jgi:hypothetical protein
MKATGYMVEAELHDGVLTLRGTTGPGRVALLGEEHKEGEVSFPAFHVASVELREPKLMGLVNGNLIVRTEDGVRFQLHFRKQDAEGMRALAAALSW